MYENVQSQGFRTVPGGRSNVAAETFNGTYVRPNPQSSGMVPARPPFCDSPDIWIAGTTPVADFQKTLATPESYAKSSGRGLAVNQTNYIYVRGRNGAATNQTNSVQLYYAPNGIIQWPGQWVDNVILTDQDNEMAFIANLPPKAVGVANQTFLWKDVPRPPAGSDHYCLFAQLNNELNQNPFPPVYTQIDMAALLRNNLWWGWRNTTLVPGQGNVDLSYTQRLTIPGDISPGSMEYFVYLTATGFFGWTVWFTCSQNDAKGKPIQIEPIKIGQGSPIHGVKCVLEPGFDAVVTVYLQSNKNSASPGATLPLCCTYLTLPEEVEEAHRRGLVDEDLDARLRASIPGLAPRPALHLGANPFEAITA